MYNKQQVFIGVVIIIIGVMSLLGNIHLGQDFNSR